MNILPGKNETSATQGNSYTAPLFFFLFGLIFITLQHSNYFRAIPGDLGDARFNSLILEHLYRWLLGKDSSLWSPGFFYPYPGSLSFSDNHFGTVAIYVLIRALGATQDYAFIGWYTVAFPLNYFCCYYALRKFDLTKHGSALGAFVFTFSIAATVQYEHAQLGYRFAIPLGMLAWRQFTISGDSRELARTAVWVAVQFYCSIYLGYFLSLLLATSFLAHYLTKDALVRPHQFFFELIKASQKHVSSFAIVVSSLIALAILFYPYLHYSKLYGFHRDRAEIFSMLPRIWSYFLADNSRLWAGLSLKIPAILMRHEQQMFFGLAAILLALIGCIKNSNAITRNALISLLLLIVVTLDVHGHTLYRLLMHLPVANAIRAVSRIGMVMLFPLAVLAGAGFDWLMRPPIAYIKPVSGALLMALMFAEYATLSTVYVPISQWRAHVAALEKQLPTSLPKDDIIFFPLKHDTPLFMSELDGMSLSQETNRNTLNGYSGNAPLNFYSADLSPCDQAISRVEGYIAFAKKDNTALRNLLGRLVIVGNDEECHFPSTMPSRTHFRGPISRALIASIHLSVTQISLERGKLVGTLLLRNEGNSLLPSISDTHQPIRVSWRLQNLDVPVSLDAQWNPRMDLVSDIPAHGSWQTYVSIEAPKIPGRYKLQASIVQDGVAWFHDVGMPIGTSAQSLVIDARQTATIVQQ